MNSKDIVDEDADHDGYDSDEAPPEESRIAANSIKSAYRLLTPSVKVFFFSNSLCLILSMIILICIECHMMIN